MHESMHDVSHLISILAASIPVRRACLLSNETHYCVCDECAMATCRTLFQNVTVSRSSSKHVSAWFSRALFLQKPAKQLGGKGVFVIVCQVMRPCTRLSACQSQEGHVSTATQTFLIFLAS